jgi:peptidoglycan hydrolase CwlO-like protein
VKLTTELSGEEYDMTTQEKTCNQKLVDKLHVEIGRREKRISKLQEKIRREEERIESCQQEIADEESYPEPEAEEA